MSYRHWRFRYYGLLTLGFLAFSSAAVAQEKSAKDLIVGNWALSIADHVRADGTKVPGFGPLPSGSATFGADGRYLLKISRSTPAPASSGTVGGGAGQDAEQVTLSGTYAIDDSEKALTIKFDQSSLPSWSSTIQKERIEFLVGDDFGWITQKPLSASSDFVATELIWRRAK